MQKNLLIAIALAFVADVAQAQTTTIGGGSAPYSLDGGYNSDYSPDGTIVLADGIVTLINNATYEHGNNLMQNDGSWTSASGSLDLFLNAGSNIISGSAAPAFFNVNFNIGAGNTMAITNTQGINVAGALQFNNGITTTVRSNTSTGAVHFAAGATYTGGTTDVQHVDGYVSKAGNTAFTFPVGSGTDVRTLSISAPATTTEISTAWFAGNPGTVTDPSDGTVHSAASFAAPIQSVSTAGFWDWIPVAGSDDGLTVTVSIPDMSASSVLPADLRLVGWNGTQWIDLSGSGNATGNTENSTLSGTIPAGITISALGIGSINTPLPVHFNAFDAFANQCNVQLSWSTAMEINNDHFVVERSNDGRLFIGIATVQSMGNSSEKQDYSYIDEHPADGLNYYRIRQVDLDGKHTATHVKQVYIHCNGDDAIRVFPTVSNNTVNVILPKRYEDVTVTVLTTLGQKVNVPVEKTNGSYRINIAPLAAAMYMIHIQKGEEVKTFKIVRED
jgi:hypothetical protein